MRILHTTDWHLGRTLHGWSRHAEHERLVDELVDLAAEVDLVIVSGDVFENSNPPIEAEELYFDALARLGDGGRRAVVVIAGNHDSPDRLCACAPLTRRHGVHIVGKGGGETLRLDLASGERAIVGALPYPSEARLGEILSDSLEDEVRQRAYHDRVAALLGGMAAAFEPGAVNVLTSHLAVRSCMPAGSERALIGGAWQVDGSAFPESAQYVALGHLHLAQAVPDSVAPARYAGSPLAMRFSERDYPRSHVLVQASAGRPAEIELVPVRAGRELVAWSARSVEEVEQGVADGRFAGAFVDLELQLSARPTLQELVRLRGLDRSWVRVRVTLPEAEVTELAALPRRGDWPLPDLFRAFYREQTGSEPNTDLVDLFVALAEGGAESARAAG